VNGGICIPVARSTAMHDALDAAQISSHVFGGASDSGAVVKQDRPDSCTLTALPPGEFSNGAGAHDRSARGRKRMPR
jgi:hypothetical protein